MWELGPGRMAAELREKSSVSVDSERKRIDDSNCILLVW